MGHEILKIVSVDSHKTKLTRFEFGPNLFRDGNFNRVIIYRDGVNVPDIVINVVREVAIVHFDEKVETQEDAHARESQDILSLGLQFLL